MFGCILDYLTIFYEACCLQHLKWLYINYYTNVCNLFRYNLKWIAISLTASQATDTVDLSS